MLLLRCVQKPRPCAQPGTEAVAWVTTSWKCSLTRDITQYDKTLQGQRQEEDKKEERGGGEGDRVVQICEVCCMSVGFLFCSWFYSYSIPMVLLFTATLLYLCVRLLLSIYGKHTRDTQDNLATCQIWRNS